MNNENLVFENNKSIEDYIRNFNIGWIRLFPDNPELENVFIN